MKIILACLLFFLQSFPASALSPLCRQTLEFTTLNLKGHDNKVDFNGLAADVSIYKDGVAIAAFVKNVLAHTGYDFEPELVDYYFREIQVKNGVVRTDKINEALASIYVQTHYPSWINKWKRDIKFREYIYQQTEIRLMQIHINDIMNDFHLTVPPTTSQRRIETAKSVSKKTASLALSLSSLAVGFSPWVLLPLAQNIIGEILPKQFDARWNQIKRISGVIVLGVALVFASQHPHPFVLPIEQVLSTKAKVVAIQKDMVSNHGQEVADEIYASAEEEFVESHGGRHPDPTIDKVWWVHNHEASYNTDLNQYILK